MFSLPHKSISWWDKVTPHNLCVGSSFIFALILFQLLIANTYSQTRFDLNAYFEQNKQQDKATFVQNFPYAKYLQLTKFTDFKTLQSDRFFLYQKFGDGDDFLYYLGENYIKNYPVGSSLKELNANVDIGVDYLNPKKGFNRGTDAIYHIIGYFILGKVAQKIGSEIRNNKFDPNDSNNAQLLKRLEENKVYVTIEQGGLAKIKDVILRRDYRYFLERGLTKARENPKIVIAILTPILILLLYFIARSFRAKRIKSAIFYITIAIFAVIGLFSPYIALQGKTTRPPDGTTPPTDGKTAPKTSYKMQFYKNMHQINTSQDFSVQIFKVYDGNHNEIGQALWLQRPSLKATYFACKPVLSKYQNFKATHAVVLATTGGFTNQFSQPEGLTIEDGNIVNAVLMPDRHGLVMVSNGGIQVLNLKNPTVKLPKGVALKVEEIVNPLNSLIAYSKLLGWCKANRATLFQTQLLAFSDTITISEKKAKPQNRERRILALVSDKKNTSEIHHVVFNITTQYNLAEIANEVFAMLASRNKKVEAVLNLDVGSYNIMDVFDENGNPLNDIRGMFSVDRATNLIVYSK